MEGVSRHSAKTSPYMSKWIDGAPFATAELVQASLQRKTNVSELKYTSYSAAGSTMVAAISNHPSGSPAFGTGTLVKVLKVVS